MSWKQETGPDGLPIWRGKDSLLNEHAQLAGCLFWLSVPSGILAIIFGMSGCSKGGNVNEAFGGLFVIVGLCFLCAPLIMKLTGFSRKQWSGEAWMLAASPDGLLASGSHSWMVLLGDVASVEAGQNWDGTRLARSPIWKSQGVWHDTSHEWQTFLVLADQSRRVVHTANADREGCTTLSASIRAYVEAARSRSIAAPPAASIPPASPSGEGFDL